MPVSFATNSNYVHPNLPFISSLCHSRESGNPVFFVLFVSSWLNLLLLPFPFFSLSLPINFPFVFPCLFLLASLKFKVGRPAVASAGRPVISLSQSLTEDVSYFQPPYFPGMGYPSRDEGLTASFAHRREIRSEGLWTVFRSLPNNPTSCE